jgi:hypothetical protein
MCLLNHVELVKLLNIFTDESEVVTNLKLRCTACCSSLQSVVSEGRDIFHHPVLKVLMCKVCCLSITVNL